MRIALTLEDDVAAKLRQEKARTGAGMDELVNAYLRRALEAPWAEETAQPFSVQAESMKLKAGVDLNSTSGVIDLLGDAKARLS